ncbi:alpha/beta hydrolase [Kitasatospora camelliae]|uniref:Alpha/beta hydrolase n=1 Tax=Kitasatospora camelliae TaxID=3156397 RepID=A0AAU8JYZ7_9ACTN
MTAFVLVSGTFTGGWIWEDVAARLREAGAEAYPVTLTGMGGDSGTGDPGTDLETHIEDLLRVIDGLSAPELVLVGHEYAVHPVLGAADRRPGRIGRVVHLDAGMPTDGDAAVALVPDPEVRERLLQDGPGAADGWSVPVPGPDGWSRWGSTEGLGEEALARLTALAVPQPAATLTRPLRLTGAVEGVPASGIFCTAGGMSISVLEGMTASGLPQFQALADRRVTFFDLATGHWPMLSAPAELAEALLRAAAGEGHRVTAPTGDQQPFYLRPFLLDTPEPRRERTGPVDLYLPADASPADGPRPAVLLVHGGPIPPDLKPTPRDWSTYTGYGAHLAAQGVIAATVDHRLYGLTEYPVAARDVAAAVDLLRADPRVDGERIALWFFSGGGLLAAPWLAAAPAWLRCVALTYPIAVPLPGWGQVDAAFRPADALGAPGQPPVVLTRAGLEEVEIAATVEQFLAAAEERKAEIEVIEVPEGRHGFETLDHTDGTREAVTRAVGAVLAHLRRP